MPIMEISIVPIGTKTVSLSQYVANAINVLQNEKNIKYTLTSMGTIIEAESVKKLLKIAGKMHNSVFNKKNKRVVTTIKLDDRKDKKVTMNNKIKSVEKKLKNKKLDIF